MSMRAFISSVHHLVKYVTLWWYNQKEVLFDAAIGGIYE